MKWYNYRNYWLNLNEFSGIVLNNMCEINIYQKGCDDPFTLKFKNDEEREAEFEKIKVLMNSQN